MIGIALICVSILIFNYNNDFKRIAVPITGVISDIRTFQSKEETKHEVYVDYEYEGKVYRDLVINSYNSGMFVGKEIKIYVNPNFPSEAKYITNIGVFILGGFGVIFLFVGLWILLIIKDRKLEEELDPWMKEDW